MNNDDAECCACGLVHPCVPRDDDTTAYSDANSGLALAAAVNAETQVLRQALQSARNVLLNHARQNPSDATCAHEAESIRQVLEAP